MGGIFGTISHEECINDLFYGTDYNSHMGTKRGGLATWTGSGLRRSIHNLENAYFRSKFEGELDKLTVTDMDGQEVAYIHQKVLSLVPKYFIEVDGQEMELKGHITLLKPHYTLETDSGNWEIRGDFVQHEYEMKRGREVVATVTRKWLSWGDTYLLDVPDERDALTALGVMVAIDCVNADTNHAQSATIAND